MESKLKSAYVNKERAAQVAEQEAMRFETMVSRDSMLLNIENGKELPVFIKELRITLTSV